MTTARTATPGPAPTAIDRRLELLGFVAIVVVAAILRLPGLAERGMWDADQGRHMLDLRAFVLGGQVPLLGPATSIGNFHHGVLYYDLLAPAAFLSHGDPVAVEALIAWCGVAAVAVVGWLARAIGGTAAGLIAAALVAVSASAVSQSIFIWNPNLILFSSAIALAASWRAWQGWAPRWWIGAGAAVIATMQFHVLGALLAPVVGGLMVADVRRRRGAGDRRGVAGVRSAAVAIVLLGVASYTPLLIHELETGGAELRGAIAFLTAGGEPAATALPARIVIVGLRVLGWPLTGLITAAPVATLLSCTLVIGLVIWMAMPGRGAASPADDRRTAARWLGLGLAWTILGLAVGSASLATVVPGQANDDYHAFADPMVFVIVGVGLASIARRAWPVPARRPLAGMVAAIVLALIGWNLATQPPARAADGGWAAAEAAAGRIVVASGGGPIVLSSLPTFKGDEAVRMPLEAIGAPLVPAGAAGAAVDPAAVRVILCDELYGSAIGADCGGPAEDAWLANPSSGLATAAATPAPAALVDRFEAAPGRWISIYRP